MNAQPLPAFEVLLKSEGKLTRGDDNGRGRANMGVTQLTLDDIRKRGSGTYWATLPEKVEDLKEGEVFAIFRDAYWFPSGAGKIFDQRLATAYSNLYYQTSPAFGGVSNATKALQRAVGAKPDGVFGPVTAQAIALRNPDTVLAAFKAEMLAHYEHLARENPERYADDLGGWKKRLNELCGEGNQ